MSIVNELRKLTEDAALFDRLKETARLVEKWEATTLLNGNEGGKYSALKKAHLAQLLQNSAVLMRQQLSEATDTGDISGFNKIAFPLVKKTFDKLIAERLVSFQTLNQPSGLIFFQDYQFETSKPGFTAGSPIYQDLDTSVSGRLGGRGAGLATGGFYGLKSWYSKNLMTQASVAVSGNGSSTIQILVPIASLTGIGAGVDETFPIFISGTAGADSVSAEFVSFTGANAVFEILGGATTAALSATLPFTTASVTHVPATNLTNRGDWESLSAIPSINLRTANIPVYAEARKVQTSWTQEGQQDLMAYQGVDAEVELSNTLSDIASTEINNNILNDLLLTARSNRDYWSYRIGDYVDNSGASLTGHGTTAYVGFHGTQKEWSETLINKIEKQMNQIFKKTFLATGSEYTAVVSPDVATIVSQGLNWKSHEGPGGTYSAGVEDMGRIDNKISFIKHASFPTNDILIARKGTNWLDTGYVYAPYVLLYMTQTVLDPNNYTPRKMIMTRDVRQTIKPEYFARIRVLNTSEV